MSRTSCDVAVAGGGLVGLSLAYELATRGAHVTVIDAAFPGRATDAGAGILSPDTTAVDDDARWELSRGAGAHYPALLERLREDGVDTAATGYAACGLLSVGLRESEESWFEPFSRLVARRAGGVVTEIAPEEAVSLFPPLGRVHRVLHSPGSCRVDGWGMAAALREGAAANGVRFVAGRVVGVVADRSWGGERRVGRVEVEGAADVVCGACAVAGGAWSASMGEWFGVSLPITPTKGQIVHLGVPGDTGAWPIVQPLLTHYLVPWPDGRVVCGGTFETGVGFSAEVTAAGLHELLREGLSVAPGLADATYLETRVGLRPTSSDDVPVVGRLPGWENASVATGHGASGLLLGPFTSRLLAALLLTGEPAALGGEFLAGLSPSRFS
jgi:glycine/D-amino acid oxidase-like deaminating enzyme